MSGFSWEEAESYVPEESAGGEFEKPPVGAWMLVQISGQENEKARPALRVNTTRDGEEYSTFSCGFIAVGGDAKADQQKHNGAFLWFRSSLNLKDEPDKLSGKLTGFMNAAFAPGVGNHLVAEKGASKEQREAMARERARLRWGVTRDHLTPIVKSEGIDKQTSTLPQAAAAAAAFALNDGTKRYVICKVGKNDYKKDGEVVKDVQPVQVRDYTAEAMTELGIAVWDDSVPPPAATAAAIGF